MESMGTQIPQKRGIHMGKKACGSKSMDAVESCVCREPKLSIITPYRVERKCGIDHNIAAACLDSMAPEPGQSSTYELCEESAGARWLIKSVSNPNEYWLDENEKCVVKSIMAADKHTYLPHAKREEIARTLVARCAGQTLADDNWLVPVICIGIGVAVLGCLAFIAALINPNQAASDCVGDSGQLSYMPVLRDIRYKFARFL